MRARHVIAVVAIVVLSFGLKMFFFSAPIAEANAQMKPLAAQAADHTDASRRDIGAPPYP